MITNGRIWLCALFLAGFWACSDDSENVNEDVTTEDVENASTIDDASIPFLDAVTISTEILSEEEVMVGRTQNCFVTSTTQNENQLLVTFESSCTGEDGKVRSGSILLEWSGSQENNDFSYTAVFDGYKVDDYGLAGSITVSGLTFKENGFGYSCLVNDGMVTCPDGKQILYEQDFDYDFTFSEGLEIRITGAATGTGKEGNSYTANIKEAILVVSGCEHAVSGSFDATFNDRPTFTFSYGDGTCDNKGTLSRGDFQREVELD